MLRISPIGAGIPSACQLAARRCSPPPRLRWAGRSLDPPLQNRAQEPVEMGQDQLPPLFDCESLASAGETWPGLLLKTGSKCAILYVICRILCSLASGSQAACDWWLIRRAVGRLNAMKKLSQLKV
jgi:hypothetical protein